MNRLLIGLLSLTLTLSSLGPVWAAEEEASPLEAELSVDAFSAYVWRGQVLNEDPVLQPQWTISKGGFALNVWASYNLTDKLGDDLKNEFSEVDLTASYTHLVGPVEFEIGVAEFLFPNQSDTEESETVTNAFAVPNTREVYLSAALPDVILTPTVTVSYDFEEVEGFYAAIELSHSLEISDMIALDLAFSTGAGDEEYNKYYFGLDDMKLNDGNVSAALPVTLSESWTVTPAITYTWLWDSDVKDSAKENDAYFNKDNLLWGGVTVAYTF